MKNTINIEQMIKDYEQLQSCYRVASLHGVSHKTVQNYLKKLGVLKSKSEAASIRNLKYGIAGKYKRTAEHIKQNSERAKLRTGDKNTFFGKTHSEESKAIFRANCQKRAGKRNPNYKNGLYKRRERDYKLAEFKPVRKACFERDSHTCQMCNKKGGDLHAHHKLPNWLVPEAYLDLDNVVTVCNECHFSKCHLLDWTKFEISFISDELIQKYSFDRERLSELATLNGRSDSPTSTNT